MDKQATHTTPSWFLGIWRAVLLVTFGGGLYGEGDNPSASVTWLI